jgi:hypothetical protein
MQQTPLKLPAMGIRTADGDEASFLTQMVPERERFSAGPPEALGLEEDAVEAMNGALDALFPPGHEVPDTDSGKACHRKVIPGISDGPLAERHALFKRVRKKSEPPLLVHQIDDPLRVQALLADHLPQIIGQVMMGHFPDFQTAKHEHTSIEPLLFKVQIVHHEIVVIDEDKGESRPARRLRYLLHVADTVRMAGVDMKVSNVFHLMGSIHSHPKP